MLANVTLLCFSNFLGVHSPMVTISGPENRNVVSQKIVRSQDFFAWYSDSALDLSLFHVN